MCLPMQEMQEMCISGRFLGQEDPLLRGHGNPLPTPVFLSGETHGQRSLVDYSPGGDKELDTTKVTKCMYVCVCVRTC